MEIKVFRSNAELPDHLRWQILSLIRIEWYEAAGDYTGPGALPDEWHPCHVVGLEGEAILSYAGIVWREVEHAGQVLSTYGLCSVFTFPARRGEGLGTKVVRHATSRIEQAGDGDVAVLFTAPGIEPFYQRAGWQPMPSAEFLIGDPAAPQVHDAVAMMLFLSARGRAQRAALEHGPIYFGEFPW